MVAGNEGNRWVKLRSECSPLEMFLKLKEGTKEDAEARNSLNAPDSTVSFKIVLLNGKAFSVIRQGSEVYGVVSFYWDKSGIEVRDREDKATVKATLTLTDEAECKFKMPDGTELSLWQFRKRMLEDLFFNF